MDFSKALQLLKEGKKLQRSGWKTNCFVFLVSGSEFKVNRAPLNEFFDHETIIEYQPHIDVCIGNRVSVWDAQTMDILAEDWCIHG